MRGLMGEHWDYFKKFDIAEEMDKDVTRLTGF
ncbi:hypothetical protein MY11210_006660 [Beauveria gryllotalpidicola]